MLIDEFMDKVIKLRLSSLDLVDKNSVFVLVIKVTTDPDSAQWWSYPASNISKIILEKKKEKNEEFN